MPSPALLRFLCAATAAVSVATARAEPADRAAVSVTVRIPSGQSLFCPPLSDGRFDGELGAALAGVADEVALPGEGSDGFTLLKRNVRGQWCDERGSLWTNILPEGHGFLVTRRATGEAQVTFTGTPTPRRCVIPEGRSIIGLAQVTDVPLQAAFASPREGTIAASFDETKADILAFLAADGSWRRFIRTPDHGWFDIRASAPAAGVFRPGEACYYLRQAGQGPLVIDF